MERLQMKDDEKMKKRKPRIRKKKQENWMLGYFKRAENATNTERDVS